MLKQLCRNWQWMVSGWMTLNRKLVATQSPITSFLLHATIINCTGSSTVLYRAILSLLHPPSRYRRHLIHARKQSQAVLEQMHIQSAVRHLAPSSLTTRTMSNTCLRKHFSEVWPAWSALFVGVRWAQKLYMAEKQCNKIFFLKSYHSNRSYGPRLLIVSDDSTI
jgi:hypothetical protein